MLLAYPVKALALLYDRFYHGLFTISWSLTHDLFASEDILQETFVHVWENRRVLGQPQERSIENYLVRVVKYKSITYYKQTRKRDQRKALLIHGHPHQRGEFSMEERIIREEVAREIRGFIASFPRAERECLLFKIEDELSNAEIAEKMQISVKAVERSLTRGYKRLRVRWQERDEQQAKQIVLREK